MLKLFFIACALALAVSAAKAQNTPAPCDPANVTTSSNLVAWGYDEICPQLYSCTFQVVTYDNFYGTTCNVEVINGCCDPAQGAAQVRKKNYTRALLARARANNRVRIIKAQVPNSDCGEVWVEFFRCVADSTCGPGQKYCTWIFNSEFCGSWDTRGCWP